MKLPSEAQNNLAKISFLFALRRWRNENIISGGRRNSRWIPSLVFDWDKEGHAVSPFLEFRSYALGNYDLGRAGGKLVYSRRLPRLAAPPPRSPLPLARLARRPWGRPLSPGVLLQSVVCTNKRALRRAAQGSVGLRRAAAGCVCLAYEGGRL